VQTTDEGFSRPLILSIHLSASKFANLDVTASRKSENFDRVCASGWSGHRDPQSLTESQSSSSILANRHYFVCCRRKKRICFVADRQTFSLWENFLIFFDELVAVQDLQRMTEGTLAGIWVLTRRRQNRYQCALQPASLLFFLCSHFCL
jgi:hypothetical protein